MRKRLMDRPRAGSRGLAPNLLKEAPSYERNNNGNSKHLGSRNGESGNRDSNRKEGYRPGENAVIVAQSPPGISCRHFDRGGRLYPGNGDGHYRGETDRSLKGGKYPDSTTA